MLKMFEGRQEEDPCLAILCLKVKVALKTVFLLLKLARPPYVL